MNPDTAFAVGFIVGWVSVCVLRLLWILEARVENATRERMASKPPTVAPKSETGIPRPRIGPKGGTGTPPLPRGWPSTYPIPADELPPQSGAQVVGVHYNPQEFHEGQP